MKAKVRNKLEKFTNPSSVSSFKRRPWNLEKILKEHKCCPKWRETYRMSPAGMIYLRYEIHLCIIESEREIFSASHFTLTTSLHGKEIEETSGTFSVVFM
jgi:hypothetical protein